MRKVLFLTLSLIALSSQRTQKNIQCPQGHLSLSGSCRPITYVQGCATYLHNNDCKSCEYGYALQQGQCLVNNNETSDCCASYSPDGTCLKCNQGLFPSDPYCLRNEIYGCIQKSDNQCLVCGSGLVLSNGICIKPIPECSSYNENGVCIKCKDHYKLVNNYCYPFPNIDNCNIPSEYGCIECAQNYYLTQQKSCQLFEPGCLSYWQQKCVSCLSNFKLYQGKCFIHACKIYTANGCAECYKGYSYVHGKCEYNGCTKVVNKKCVECRQGLRLSSNGCVPEAEYQCTSCAQGYQWNNNVCIKVIFGCLEYNSNQQCLKCRSPFELAVNGECQINGCQKYCQQGCLSCLAPFALTNHICAIEFCTKYNSNGCAQCQEGYMLAGRHCHPKDPNCLGYDLVNHKPQCSQCADQYYLLNGECKPAEKGCQYDSQGNCKCKPTFIPKNGKCEIVGCSKYNWEQCLACYAPFQFNQQSGSCSIPYCLKYTWSGCNNCEKGWLVNNGECFKGDPYCINYDQSHQCQACKKGFVLTSGQCIKNIPFCSLFAEDNLSCLKCQKGYTLFQGYCKKVIPYCNNMDFQNDICTCCDSGYHLVNGQCRQNDPNCLSYSKNGNTQICSSCKDGYFYDPNTNQCQPKSVGCVYEGCDCVSCIQPFTYDQQRQECYIPGCNKYNSIGCQYCVAPFSLIENNCIINYCLTYARDRCLECQQGYTVSNEGLCVKIDPNCLTYQGIKCAQCKDQFTLFKDICVVHDPKCVSYDQNGLCSRCVANYHPDCNGRCIPDAPGCIYNNGDCSSCQAPFKYNPSYKSCQIPNCKEADFSGCLACRAPFTITQDKRCELANCLRFDYNGCLQCKALYHLNNGGCVEDSINCLVYSPVGICELCADGFIVGANGECVEGNQACLKRCSQDSSKCLQCSDGYFLNRFFQCQKQGNSCQAYTNGVCSKCQDKYFLFSDICFPYTKGCVSYSGKDCTQCKTKYVLKNGECFNWKGQGMALLGGNDVYNFDITPIDVRQSKYYINNLSPASAIGKWFFTSYFTTSYQDCSLSTLDGVTSQGWKAKVADANQFIGITLDGEPAVFYALQLEAVEGSYIKEYYLEYSVDGSKFIRVQNAFAVPSSVSNNMTTIYFTAIYAKSIRIQISKYQGWPAARLEFFYYDMIRFRKISNLKSQTYLQETINSNFVDRVDNQIYINQVYFFNPSAQCSIKEMCFTGLQLCEPRDVTELTLNFQDPSSYVTEFYLTYSVDGRSYNCYQNCKPFKITECQNSSYSMKLKGLRAQGVRVYPKNYKGSSKFSPTFFYN